jgi:ArsR family transcriptional regulator
MMQMTKLSPERLDEAEVVRALAALAQPLRLRTFRALVVAGPDGMTPGEISDLLQVAPSALSFHLKELANAGIARVEPRGRHLIYRARFDQMLALVGYLSAHCCQGAQGGSSPDACGAC